MTAVAADGADRYGAAASLHGLNVAYLVMSMVGIAMFLFALWGCREEKGLRKHT